MMAQPTAGPSLSTSQPETQTCHSCRLTFAEIRQLGGSPWGHMSSRPVTTRNGNLNVKCLETRKGAHPYYRH
jgi:hypothetical protein